MASDGLSRALLECRQAQARLQLPSVSPAQSKFRSILKHDAVFTVFAEFEASNPLEIHNGGTVNPTKGRSIEVLLEVRHAAADQVRFCPHVQAGIVVRSLDPIDFGNLQK